MAEADLQSHATLDAPPDPVSLPAPEAPPSPVPAVEVEEETPPSDVADRKRKHEDLTGADGENGVQTADDVVEKEKPVIEEANGVGGPEEETVKENEEDDGGDAKRQRVDAVADVFVPDGDQQLPSIDAPDLANGQVTPEGDDANLPLGESEKPAVYSETENITSDEPKPAFETQTTRKIEIPNSRVGVLIGRAGETIRYLQHTTRVKIQITRDVNSDPLIGVRIVELIGTVDGINKAEQLIKDVMAEADAGGSPALIARGLGTLHSGAEQLELKVPNDKVGMIIGKGGETIKSLQNRSGARIQLIPQHLPEGDLSKERTVRISGNKKQIETATELIKEVMSQGPGRPSSFSRSYQQGYRPHGPPAPQWGARPSMQPGSGFDYQQRGQYQSQGQPYPQSYGGYAQQQQQHQPPPGGNFGWEQRPSQGPSQTGGYDYYGQGQGGPSADVQQSGPPMANSVGGPASGSANYYGQQQSTGYGQPPQYSQTMPTQPNYNQGYVEPRYDAQAPMQQVYGQPSVNTQPGQYPQQVGMQPGYQQQQQAYNRPPYGGPPQVQPQSYGQPAANPQDSMYQGQYQGQNPQQNYAAGSQQQYPYGTGAPQVYGSTQVSQDGYMQQPSGGYPQYAQMAPAYTQPGQPAPVYQQTGQAYGQYQQPQQQGYGEQPVQNNAAGYYQGAPAPAGYGATTPGYGAPPAAAAYAQAPANPTTYDQSVPAQSGYAGAPAAGAQVGFAKSLSPQPQAQAQQPGYVQYDASQPQVYSHN